MDYLDSKIKVILELLDNPGKEVDFKKSLELIINLRKDIIKAYDIISPEIKKYGFLLDQIDRLYANRFEETRIDVTDAIEKKYLKDKKE